MFVDWLAVWINLSEGHVFFCDTQPHAELYTCFTMQNNRRYTKIWTITTTKLNDFIENDLKCQQNIENESRIDIL